MTDEEKRKLAEKLNRLRADIDKTLSERIRDIMEEFVGPILPPERR